MSDYGLALIGAATWSPLIPLVRQTLAVYGLDVHVDGYGFGDELAVLAGRHESFVDHPPRGAFIIQDARALFQKWLRAPRRRGDAAIDGSETAQLLIASVSRLAERTPDTSWIIATITPPYPNSGDADGNPNEADPFTRALAAFNRELWAAWDRSSFTVLDLTRLQAEWGSRLLFDPRMDQLARFPASSKGMWLLAERIAAHWAALAGRTKKVLALDCDNTLWGGIVGEDGLDGIRLGDDGPGRAFSLFQESILALEARGVLLTLCSRNNAEDVEEVFARRPEMLIPRERIVAVSINWDSKSAGVIALAKKLGLGLESFVFVDDNPREREEVRQMLPMVTVPEFPGDPADLPSFGAELGWRWFQRVRSTDEDRRKTERYRLRAASEELREQVSNPADFLRKLKMMATIRVNDSNLVFRMAQLTQKTNQFNLTLRRLTEAEMRGFLARSECQVFAGSLTDRFGDHGIVALMIIEEGPTAWCVEVCLMSCRVLGRGFEGAFATAVFSHLREQKSISIEGAFVRGPRNAQVESFYSGLGFERKTDQLDQVLYQLPANVPLETPGSFVQVEWESGQ